MSNLFDDGDPRRPKAFGDADQPNPFADDAQPEPIQENPYASPEGTSEPYKPYGYETTQPHRGGLILSLGITGLVTTIVGGVGFACCLCLPLPVVSLGLTLPAWFLGRADLRAMDAGVMDPSGRGVTQAGMITGIIGIVITALLAVVAVVMAVFFGAIGALGQNSD